MNSKLYGVLVYKMNDPQGEPASHVTRILLIYLGQQPGKFSTSLSNVLLTCEIIMYANTSLINLSIFIHWYRRVFWFRREIKAVQVLVKLRSLFPVDP